VRDAKDESGERLVVGVEEFREGGLVAPGDGLEKNLFVMDLD
jgi:hypothetical protein